MKFSYLALLILCFLFNQFADAQDKKDNLIYIDGEGVIRFTSNKKEASFFGVNYTTPFAHAYRAHKTLNVDMEEAIRQDVYHMSRLGFDAFRVHVWDTEITDSTGNLLANEHLRLFDFLIAELKKRNIKTLVTPIAFWGNGYPERDEKTPGFSTIYNKQKVLVEEKAIQAQERYLEQFFQHVNPYTGLSYRDDPDIIATEINNEPSHSGPKDMVTKYINRMNAAIRKTGWTKPVFYNISQSPYYADAVANSDAEGFSFQWYPSGLVANKEIKGNFLPHVDQYAIPFDTIPAYANKPKMVYEFDAADILQSNVYPAIARSFREAGFQWATQFAYDPMAIAYANTEYQTHYLNLAYTPAKAISMLIASKVFHHVPRLKDYGTYPTDSLFDVFRTSYREDLSEMNSETEFYNSNSTTTAPINIKKLKNIAGTGNSSLVKYTGSGAYFLDKLENGIWRLEVMPDAISIRDPFEKASLSKEVTRIEWNEQEMDISLPDLESGFVLRAINPGNEYTANANGSRFTIKPGTYLISRTGKNTARLTSESPFGASKLGEFVAPKSESKDVYLRHEPYHEVVAGKPLKIKAKVVGLNTAGKVSLIANNLSSQYKTIEMKAMSANEYEAELPAELLVPGIIKYRILVTRGNNDQTMFPGNHKGNPFAWDNYINENWESFVVSADNKLELFNASRDMEVVAFPIVWRGAIKNEFIGGIEPGQLLWSISADKLTDDHTLGMQFFFGDKIKGRADQLGMFSKLIINSRTTQTEPVTAKVSLIDKSGAAFSASFQVNPTLQQTEIPISQFKPDASMLLPRPYPGFMPLWYRSNRETLVMADIEKLEITIGSELKPGKFNQPYSLQVGSVILSR